MILSHIPSRDRWCNSASPTPLLQQDRHTWREQQRPQKRESASDLGKKLLSLCLALEAHPPHEAARHLVQQGEAGRRTGCRPVSEGPTRDMRLEEAGVELDVGTLRLHPHRAARDAVPLPGASGGAETRGHGFEKEVAQPSCCAG